MVPKFEQINEQDLSWFVGFFVGDGYVTTGRLGIDTTSAVLAERIYGILLEMSQKVKIEVYGNKESFKELGTAELNYPKKKDTHSDHVKIRIDDSKFVREFTGFKNSFIGKLQAHLTGNFLQGFFDAEATVSPTGEIEIDMSKRNKNQINMISKLLDRIGILYTLTEYELKIRLRILGTSRNIGNLKNFQQKIDFSDDRKKAELRTMINVYSRPRDKRKNVEQAVVAYLNTNPNSDIKTIMKELDVKYEFLKNSLNRLIKEGKIEKFEKNKRRCLKASH